MSVSVGRGGRIIVESFEASQSMLHINRKEHKAWKTDAVIPVLRGRFIGGGFVRCCRRATAVTMYQRDRFMFQAKYSSSPWVVGDVMDVVDKGRVACSHGR